MKKKEPLAYEMKLREQKGVAWVYDKDKGYKTRKWGQWFFVGTYKYRIAAFFGLVDDLFA